MHHYSSNMKNKKKSMFREEGEETFNIKKYILMFFVRWGIVF